jgi:hypothetical protein
MAQGSKKGSEQHAHGIPRSPDCAPADSPAASAASIITQCHDFIEYMVTAEVGRGVLLAEKECNSVRRSSACPRFLGC